MTLQEEYEEIMAELSPIGDEIGRRACYGDEEAKKIIMYYNMFYNCPEPGSLIFLKDALNEYKE